MNTVGIVALSLLLGVLLVLIIGGGVLLAVYIYHTRKDHKIFTKTLNVMLDTHAGNFDATSREMSEQLESLKGTVTGTRTEMRKSQEAFIVEVRETLSKHREEMGVLVSRINGEALQAAAANIIRASKQLTDVAAAVQQLIFAQDEEQVPRNLQPEEAAPDGHSFYEQSPIARMDYQAEQEELAPTGE